MAKQIGLGVVIDFADAKRGLEQVRGGMEKARSSAQTFGNALGSLSSELGSAGRAFGGLASMLAAGSLAGAASAAFMTIIGYLKDVQRETAETAKAFDEKLKGSLEKLTGYVDVARAARQEAQGMDPKLIEFGRELVAVQQKMQAIRKLAGEKQGGNLFPEQFREMEELRKQYDRVIETRRQYVQETAAGASAKAATKAAQDARRAGQDATRDAARQEEERARQGQAALDARARSYERAQKQRLDDARRQALAEAEAMTGYEEDGARAPEYQDLKSKDFAADQRRYNDELTRSVALSQQWGSTLGDVFGQLVAGQMNAAQAVAAVGQQIIQTVTQTAIASITADASRAAAGAAASQAGIPVVGPALAVSAMGAMLAAVLGLLGNIGARAKGGPVFSRSPYVVGERGPELFVPSMGGTIVPNGALAAAGAGAGPSVVNNYVIQAMDTRSFYSALKSNDGQLIRVLNEAAKDGRF
ncbi:hypothetical protein A2cp1_1312 [Anaeromyxobacter dehalogenans 2CP-1]|uniref:Uncharacterized protein n=1 Tax=Anaeromyxobacter dehalogenans (strain ATCC BAA-258 / DSM 21875 / 2CP-1) TaxID=455488 RepID=B8JGI5_ANAD2|nr:hypothetical protein [Anaeromyxobacter dehalogenans]ACL64656.1 hypothetical protein A2cp1_1312 [Anaeromyxobacter dehalogenans 2CP-1]